MEALDWLKKHPIAAAAGIFTLGLLFILMRGRSTGTQTQTAGPSDQYLAAQLATSAQIQGTQIAAQVQTNHDSLAAQVAEQQLFASLAATKLQVGGQVDAANLAARVQMAGIESQTQQTSIAAQVQEAGLRAQTTVASYSRDVQLAGITANSQDYMANIDAARQMTLASYDAQKVLADIASKTTLGVESLKERFGEVQVGAQEQIDLAGINSQQAVDLASLSTAQAISADELSTWGSEREHLINVLSSGALNKGGEGGYYQAAAFGSLLNESIPQYQKAPGDTVGGILAGAGQLAKGVAAFGF